MGCGCNQLETYVPRAEAAPLAPAKVERRETDAESLGQMVSKAQAAFGTFRASSSPIPAGVETDAGTSTGAKFLVNVPAGVETDKPVRKQAASVFAAQLQQVARPVDPKRAGMMASIVAFSRANAAPAPEGATTALARAAQLAQAELDARAKRAAASQGWWSRWVAGKPADYTAPTAPPPPPAGLNADNYDVLPGWMRPAAPAPAKPGGWFSNLTAAQPKATAYTPEVKALAFGFVVDPLHTRAMTVADFRAMDRAIALPLAVDVLVYHGHASYPLAQARVTTPAGVAELQVQHKRFESAKAAIGYTNEDGEFASWWSNYDEKAAQVHARFGASGLIPV